MNDQMIETKDKIHVWLRNHIGFLLILIVLSFLTIGGGAWWAVSSINKIKADAKASADSFKLELAKLNAEIVKIQAESDKVKKENEYLKEAARKKAEAVVKLTADQKRGIVKSASIKAPIKRKLISDPVAFGYAGDTSDVKAVKKFAEIEAQNIVERAGISHLRFHKKYFKKMSIVLAKTEEGQEIIVVYLDKSDGGFYAEPDTVYQVMPSAKEAKKAKPRYYQYEVKPKPIEQADSWVDEPDCYISGSVFYDAQECQEARKHKPKQ